MLDVLALAQQCAPTVSPPTMAAILHVESNWNPYAIGTVGGRLVRQPSTRTEAIATARALEAANWNFSVGIAQINRRNLAKYALTYEQAFEPCANVRVGAKILEVGIPVDRDHRFRHRDQAVRHRDHRFR